MPNVALANELNTALSELFSQDLAVRKRAAAFLGRKPCMDCCAATHPPHGNGLSTRKPEKE